MAGASRTRRRELRRLEVALRGVLNAWDPIGGAPDDEYDCLIWPIVSRLEAGASQAEIATWLRKEMSAHFGVETGEETTQVARRLLEMRPAGST